MVRLDDLSKEIAKQVKQYTNSVMEEVEFAEDDVTKNAVKELKSLSRPRLTGDYLRGWTRKKVDGKWIVYNRTDYQLTHLLEYGHAKRDGGSVPGIPHIRPIEDKAVSDFVERVERAAKI
jgi:hypothetical protein